MNSQFPLIVHAATGLLAGARQVLSPHADQRPSGVNADLIVLHGISLPPGEFGGPWIEQLFNGHLPPEQHPYFAQIAGRRVSAHALIRRDGQIVQFVPFHLRAWHAGQSVWEGRSACNDFSIGIELEGADDVRYESVQYVRAAELVRALVAAYPLLSASRLVGHSDIAPGRKTDPGDAFDWLRMRRALQADAGAS
ncbi:MAG: 1,6-anhydro-N-acetylmuramyl-L-alanine amidase AmpD [Nevskiaceae bacterium]|jgi:AmpD protein|nr:1,6-anhydro-N-acetylmuramyl-L-alanine amidase AmpD [Nevskiaceae bacterium]